MVYHCAAAESSAPAPRLIEDVVFPAALLQRWKRKAGWVLVQHLRGLMHAVRTAAAPDGRQPIMAWFMMLTAGCVAQANDTYTKVIDLYECPPLFIYHNLTLELVMQRWGRDVEEVGGAWPREDEVCGRRGKRQGGIPPLSLLHRRPSQSSSRHPIFLCESWVICCSSIVFSLSFFCYCFM